MPTVSRFYGIVIQMYFADHGPPHFHVIYNVLRCALMLAFVGPVSRLCLRILPDPPTAATGTRPRYLDEGALSTPTVALSNAARETLRMGAIVGQMLNGLLDALETNDAGRARETRQLDDDVDQLYSAVKLYLTRLSRKDLDEADGRRWTDIISLTINLEHAGDIIERIVLDIETKKIADRLAFSPDGLQEINDLHRRLIDNLQLGLAVFLNGDLGCARKLLAEKESFGELERTYAHSHLNRLAGQSVQSLETSSLHLDVISDMKRLNSLFCSTAYPVLDEMGALHRSRLRDAEGIEAWPGGAAAGAHHRGKGTAIVDA